MNRYEKALGDMRRCQEEALRAEQGFYKRRYALRLKIEKECVTRGVPFHESLVDARVSNDPVARSFIKDNDWYLKQTQTWATVALAEKDAPEEGVVRKKPSRTEMRANGWGQ